MQINGDTYNIQRMHAKDQFNVLRKVLPVIRGLGKGFADAPSQVLDKPLSEMELSEILEVGGPLVQALYELKDEDVDYVIDKCLSRVQIKTQAGWANVAPRPGQYLFEDKMTMATMMQLVISVMQENNIISFFIEAAGQDSTTGVSQ